jgi:hypothetical protein
MVKHVAHDDPENPTSLDLIIDTKISRAMYPIYWMIGGTLFAVLTIFITIALPLQAKLMEVAITQKEKAFTSDVDKKLKDFESFYVTKFQYYQSEEDEHRMMEMLFPNIESAKYIFTQVNANIAEQLGFKYTSRGGSIK